MENLKLRDFLDYNYLSSIEVSPDKKNTAFIVHRGDYDDNDYKSNIWVMNNETKKYFRLTGMNEERSFLWLDETKILFPSMRDKKLKVKVEEGEKMSKSKGNVVDPISEIEKYGVDAFRYCLMREVQFGNDGDYSTKSVVTRINSDLANDLGNLLNRTLGMYKKYFGGVVVNGATRDKYDDEIETLWTEVVKEVEEQMNIVQYSKALEAIWKFISRLNKYIDETAPWTLAKDEANRDRLAVVMNHLVDGLYKAAVMVYPYMPTSAQKIWNQLGETRDIHTAKVEEVMGWNLLREGHVLGNAEPIFPRLDLETLEVPKKDPMQVNEDLEVENPIDITDFDKVNIQVVEILEAGKVKGADKLLKFKVSVGDHVRQILSGIAKYYPEPEKLVGKKVLAITNLKPRKMRGEISQGMLLSTEDKNGLRLVEVNTEVENGSKAK
jgi:methionyl-tRNA synthetase